MDVEKLHIVLQQSFSPDATLRDPAEETIRNLKHIKGATIMLLQVTAEKQVGFYGDSSFCASLGKCYPRSSGCCLFSSILIPLYLFFLHSKGTI
jgi:hypothetical protein